MALLATERSSRAVLWLKLRIIAQIESADMVIGHVKGGQQRVLAHVEGGQLLVVEVGHSQRCEPREVNTVELCETLATVAVAIGREIKQF